MALRKKQGLSFAHVSYTSKPHQNQLNWYHSNRKRDWCPWGDPAPPSIRFVLGKVSLICRVFNDENQHQKRMKQWKQLIDKVSNDENQHHILWCPSIIIFPIRPVMPRGKENLMALLHYPQKVTIIKILEKVTFRIVDCPTQLICTWIFICSMTTLRRGVRSAAQLRSTETRFQKCS